MQWGSQDNGAAWPYTQEKEEKKAHAFQEEKEKSAWKIRLTKGEKGCRIQMITSKSK
jgi:hypothetical protein